MRARAVMFVILVGALGACSLVTSLEGFTTPASPDAAVPDTGGGDAFVPESGADADADAGVPDAAGFPVTAILDPFNRADGPLGSSWSLFKDADVTGSFEVRASRMRFLQGADVNCGVAFGVWNTVFGARHEVYATLSSLPGYGTIELRLAVNDARDRFIAVSFDIGEAHTVSVITRNPTATFGEMGFNDLAEGDRIGGRDLGDGRVQVWHNETLLLTTTTGAFPKGRGGSIGVSAGCASSLQGLTFDDFGGGNVP